MKRLPPLILSLVLSALAFHALSRDGESWFLRSARAELSGSYFQHRQDVYHIFREFTANGSFGVTLFRGLEAGVRSQNVFARSSRIPPGRFFLMGGYAQYDMIPKSPHRFYGELSFSTGDYCPCGVYDYRREPVRYAGAGLGADFALADTRFMAGLALVVQQVIDSPRGEGAFNYLRFGVSYVIGKK